MSLHINMEQMGDVVVLQCAGRIVRGRPVCHLKEVVTSLSQRRVIMLDLSEVEILDAGGLGLLVFLHNWAWLKGIQLKLVHPSSLVTEMLELTRLTSVLHISSVEDVIHIFCNVDPAVGNVNRVAA